MFRAVGADGQPTCEQDKLMLADNINSLRASMVRAKTALWVAIPLAAAVGWFIGSRKKA
jgi:hypothetical protein